MEDKVIHEVRVIETDDGFRIEVKGDKERIRKMGFEHGFGHGFGPGMGFRRRRRHFRRHGGMRRGFHPGYGPWGHDVPEHDEAPSEGV
jgi:hypothetical protein